MIAHFEFLQRRSWSTALALPACKLPLSVEPAWQLNSQHSPKSYSCMVQLWLSLVLAPGGSQPCCGRASSKPKQLQLHLKLCCTVLGFVPSKENVIQGSAHIITGSAASHRREGMRCSLPYIFFFFPPPLRGFNFKYWQQKLLHKRQPLWLSRALKISFIFLLIFLTVIATNFSNEHRMHLFVVYSAADQAEIFRWTVQSNLY